MEGPVVFEEKEAEKSITANQMQDRDILNLPNKNEEEGTEDRNLEPYSKIIEVEVNSFLEDGSITLEIMGYLAKD